MPPASVVTSSRTTCPPGRSSWPCTPPTSPPRSRSLQTSPAPPRRRRSTWLSIWPSPTGLPDRCSSPPPAAPASPAVFRSSDSPVVEGSATGESEDRKTAGEAGAAGGGEEQRSGKPVGDGQIDNQVERLRRGGAGDVWRDLERGGELVTTI